jgi:ferredoxin-type protein NapH
VFLGVYCLYALKKYPETPFSWPFTLFLDEQSFRAAVGAVFRVAFAPFAWVFDDAAKRDIDATLWFQQGFLYSLLYTLVMIGFGWRAMMRWTKTAKRPAYQKWRYLTLVAFQVVFFLAANVVAVQALSIQNSWRAWGLYQPWPLFFHTFHWWSASDPRAVELFFVGAGLLGTFVFIPLLAWKNGKRFCTWVCGCGGLAETLGDRWRHLSPKGARSRAWEFQAFVVLLAAAVVTVVTVGAFEDRADNAWAHAYSYIVDFWLVAVIPVALYPFFGGKIWCRYWCPLAAWNQILARLYGRLGIDSNDQCISCGQCSKNCEVGVDVMQFARGQERFDNKNSSCIQCGICIDVCPVDVLSFSTKPRKLGASLPIVG